MPPKKIPPRLTRLEVNRLLAIPSRRYPTGVRNRALMRFLYRTGLRCSEALAVKLRDLDLDRGTVRVIDGKGGKDRVVYFDTTTAEAVRNWLAIKPRSNHVFCTLAGEPLKDSYVREMMARYGDKAGIGVRCRPHLMRHTFASEWLEDGGSLLELQQQLGHARLEMTAIYAHVSNERLRKWANARD